jgi:hypothetical protein
MPNPVYPPAGETVYQHLNVAEHIVITFLLDLPEGTESVLIPTEELQRILGRITAAKGALLRFANQIRRS